MKKKLLYIHSKDFGWVTTPPFVLYTMQELKQKFEETLGPDWEVEIVVAREAGERNFAADIPLVTDEIKPYINIRKYQNVVSFPSYYLVRKNFDGIKQLVNRELWKKDYHKH